MTLRNIGIIALAIAVLSLSFALWQVNRTIESITRTDQAQNRAIESLIRIEERRGTR